MVRNTDYRSQEKHKWQTGCQCITWALGWYICALQLAQCLKFLQNKKCCAFLSACPSFATHTPRSRRALTEIQPHRYTRISQVRLGLLREYVTVFKNHVTWVGRTCWQLQTFRSCLKITSKGHVLSQMQSLYLTTGCSVSIPLLPLLYR